MKRLLSLVFGSMAWAALLPLSAAAQECVNGGACTNGGAGGPVYGPEYSNGGVCAKGRGPAVLTPVEAFGVHPPGLDPADANRCWVLHRWREMWIPYYAPLSPTSTSARWKPWCYFPLMPYYTPYYCGYCPHRLCNPKPLPYGHDGGWGHGPMPDHPLPPNAGEAPLRYGVYTSVIQDDTTFWNMGGNGLVPYGTPRPPHNGPPDLVDAIQVSRSGGGPGHPPVGGVLPVAPAVAPPAEKADEKGSDRDDKERKETPAANDSAPPE
jgi:hypothetical protein